MCARYQHCCRHGDRLDNQQRRPRHPTYSIDTFMWANHQAAASSISVTWCEGDQCRCREWSKFNGRQGWRSRPCNRPTASASWHIPLKTKDIPKHSKILKDIPRTNCFFKDILRYPKKQVQKSKYPRISLTNSSKFGISWDIPNMRKKS